MLCRAASRGDGAEAGALAYWDCEAMLLTGVLAVMVGFSVAVFMEFSFNLGPAKLAGRGLRFQCHSG